VRYTLRMGLHNGRCFVGPLVQADSFAVQPGRAGSLQLVAQGQDLALGWALADEGVVLVLELLAAAQPSGEGLPGGPHARPAPPPPLPPFYP
jgi:hypothetical protein